jgi:cell cycle sensor histidine kinase DivJ
VSFFKAIGRRTAGLSHSNATNPPVEPASHERIFGGSLPVLFASLLALIVLLALFGAEYAAGRLSGLVAAGLAAPAGLYAVALAVAARKIHEMRRRIDSASQASYHVLAATIGELILSQNSSGAVLSASGDAEASFGLETRELVGRGFFNRIHVADRPALLQAISAALKREGVNCVTLRLRAGARPGSADEAEAPNFAWAEMRIRRFAAAANHRVHDGAVVVCVVRNAANGQPREEKIQAASVEAESADTWKDRLLANVSHELRTPLNAIIGFSEILASAELTPRDNCKQLEYAGIIHASAEHLLSVVNLILDMSKIEAGRFAIVPEAFDVAPLIGACCDMLRLKASEGGVELVRGPVNCPRELIADKRACRQILINLLSNAVKFTKPTGRVTIGALVEGDSLLITIEDTGIGIAPGHFSRLGDPFFQVRSSYDRMFEGTGLGLSLVRGLIGLHGGSLLLESVVAEGTRVTVRLPLDCRGRATSDAAPAPIETLPSVSRSSSVFPSPPLSRPALRDAMKEKKIA